MSVNRYESDGRPTHLYGVWRNMRDRCNNSNRLHWHRYGGRGIRVCPEWDTFDAFAEWAWANGYDPTLELDRIDNDGNYAPANCRWVTHTVNARNRSNNLRLTAWGEEKTLAAWGEDPRCVVTPKAVRQRMRQGWGIEDALSRPERSMCLRGLHELTPEARYPNGQCKSCRIEGSREYRRRKKESLLCR